MTGPGTQSNGSGGGPAVARVLLVDDHPVVRDGLSAMIDRQPDLKVVAQAEGMSEAIGIVQREPIDLAIVDISLPDGDGLELIRHMRSLDKTIQALVLSMYDELVFAETALDAGAMGYLSKEASPSKVVEALRKIRDGKYAVSEAVMERILRRRDPKPQRPEDLISPRGLQVLDKMGDGLGTAEIARALHISKKTVETHKERIKEKLGVESATQLIVLAVRRKFELGGYKAGNAGESGKGGNGGAADTPPEALAEAVPPPDDPEPPAASGARRTPAPKAPKGGAGRRKKAA